jgi:hypothetical protein
LKPADTYIKVDPATNGGQSHKPIQVVTVQMLSPVELKDARASANDEKARCLS